MFNPKQAPRVVTDGVYCGAVDENRYGWENVSP